MTDLLEPTAVYSWSCRTDGEPSCGQKSVCSSWTPDFILGRKSNSQYSQCCLLLHSNGRLKMDRRASLKWSHPSATSAFPWHLNPDAVTSSFAIKERRRRSRKKKEEEKRKRKDQKEHTVISGWSPSLFHSSSFFLVRWEGLLWMLHTGLRLKSSLT